MPEYESAMRTPFTSIDLARPPSWVSSMKLTPLDDTESSSPDGPRENVAVSPDGVEMAAIRPSSYERRQPAMPSLPTIENLRHFA